MIQTQLKASIVLVEILYLFWTSQNSLFAEDSVRKTRQKIYWGRPYSKRLSEYPNYQQKSELKSRVRYHTGK